MSTRGRLARPAPRRGVSKIAGPARILFLGAVISACCGASQAQTLKFRFIGNAAYEITDGETTLLVDFPYESGAFGYMVYPREEVHPRQDSLCLFTHAHQDHFSGASVNKVGCTVAGPTQMTESATLQKVPVLPLAGEVTFKSMKIVPIQTPHAEIEHYSYLVSWHGLKLYFTGDTEQARTVAQAAELDVLFITPWLAEGLLKLKKEPWATKVVIYHHNPGESIAACSSCTVPSQRDSFEMPWK